MENVMTANSTMILETCVGPDETDLVRAAQKGDLEAFNQIVLCYQDRVYAMALRILGNEVSAEDITQNTFLKAYLYLPRFRNGSFRSWLYRVAINACFDELRKYKRHPQLSLDNESDEEERLLPPSDFLDSSALPEKELEKHELEHAVQLALGRLDADQRAVVVLVDMQDLDYQEAAQVLGVPIGTIKSRLARARIQMRKLLVEKI